MQIAFKSYVYLLLWFGFIALCSQLTPYFANDYRYMLITGSHDQVSSLWDIAISQYRHYFEWGGRSIAHCIAQFLLYAGKPASAVIQAFAYVLLVLFVYFNAYGVRPTLRISLVPVVFITVVLFLQMRGFGEVVLNIVSSANYMYMLLLVLIYMLPYRLSMNTEYMDGGLAFCVWMFVSGLLAGWSNEATSAACAAAVGLYLLFNLTHRRIKTWQITGYAGFLIGFALLILAPGNRARLDSMEDKGFDYAAHIFSGLEIMFESLLVSLPLLIVLGYLFYRVMKCGCFRDHKVQFRAAQWYLFTGVLSLVLMAFSPNFPIRAVSTFTVFMTVAAANLGRMLFEHYGRIFTGRVCNIVMAAACVFTFAVMCNMARLYVVLHDDSMARDAQIYRQLESGAQDLTVDPLSVRTNKYIYVADVRGSADFWTNKIVANYYNVRSIVRTRDLVKEKVHYDLVYFPNRLQEKDFTEAASAKSADGGKKERKGQ